MEFIGKDWNVTNVWLLPGGVKCGFCEATTIRTPNYRAKAIRPGAELTILACGDCFNKYLKPPEANTTASTVDVEA